MAWKNYSFEAIEQLDTQDHIGDPQGRYRSKYAYITEKGRQKARKLLAEMGIETGDLYDRFDFREIHQDEVEQAAEIEKVCFPPNEACSREHMIERAKAAPELFLVAADKSNGRIAGFLNGIATPDKL